MLYSPQLTVGPSLPSLTAKDFGDMCTPMGTSTPVAEEWEKTTDARRRALRFQLVPWFGKTFSFNL